MDRFNENGETSKIIRLSELKKKKVRGISDLADRLGYRYSTERPFNRKFIDEHGLVQGLYNVYINPADRKKFHCEVPGCDEILQEIYFRIVAAMDADSEWYTLNSMAKDPAVYEALINTNRKVVMCLEHKAPAVIVVGDQKLTVPAKISQIDEGRRIRNKRKGRLHRPV
jgi:hypothetical protein